MRAAPAAPRRGWRKCSRNARAAGEIQIRDSRLAARFFVGMVRGDIQLEVVLGVRTAPDESEIEPTVAAAVDIFLRGIEAPGGA